MSEFEKELEKNMKLNKVAYEKENIYSDFLVSKRDIERVFHDWQPPKPLVEVPKIVAYFIKTLKIRGIKPLMDSATFGEISFTEEERDEILNWINEHQEEYMRSWLDGYTVEKEKLYEIRLPLPNGNYASIDFKGYIWGEVIPNKYKLTESEVKNIDERYWTFAVPVEEVEP